MGNSLNSTMALRHLPPPEYVFSAFPIPRSKCLAPFQSQRDCVLQPRVARNELPWVRGPLNLNPERVPSKTLNRYFPEGEGRGEGEQRTEISPLPSQIRASEFGLLSGFGIRNSAFLALLVSFLF